MSGSQGLRGGQGRELSWAVVWSQLEFSFSLTPQGSLEHE